MDATSIRSEVDTWLGRLESAESDEERLFYLSRIQALDPRNGRAKQLMAQTLKRYVRKQPFLAYLEEDANSYRVRTARDLILVVAKDRAVPESYSADRFGRLGPAYRSTLLAVLGLLLSGPITIFFAILSIVAALRAAAATRGPARARALIIIAIALAILPPAAGLTYLLWLHMRG